MSDHDPRAEELACVDAQEREFLRASESVRPEDRARLERLDHAVREAVHGGARRRRSIVSIAAPVLAAAAVLAGVVLFPRERPPDEPVLRGDAGAALRVESVVTEEDGRRVARFEWPVRDGADAYAVLVLDRDRATVARLEVGAGNRAGWEVPAALPVGELMCVVIAYREGREVERSAVQPLGEPPR